MFHDVGWPHARRDTYYAPERIPEEHRQPLAHDVCSRRRAGRGGAGACRYEWAAAREGGPRNGVLTAIEDFIAERDGPRLAVVPAFFGFGVLWHTDAPWAGEVAAIVEPWDRNPVLARLEADRVTHLCAPGASSRRSSSRLERRIAEQEQLLRALLDSQAFALGDRLSRLRQARRAPPPGASRSSEALGERGPGSSRSRASVRGRVRPSRLCVPPAAEELSAGRGAAR